MNKIKLNEVILTQPLTKKGLYYAGSKHKVVEQIKEYLPDKIKNLYVPFCGGLNDVINIKADEYYLNDNCQQLVELYNWFKKVPSFAYINNAIKCLINYNWLSDDNKEGYLQLREDYNNTFTWKNEKLLTLICHSFSNQIRFNNKGEFNLPFGMRSYNKESEKRLNNLTDFFKNNYVNLMYGDYKIFFNIYHKFISKDDFVLIDPPYAQSDSTYNKNWNEDDLNRLLEHLIDTNIRFGLTEFLFYKGDLNFVLNNWIKKNETKLKIIKLNSNFDNSNYQRKSDIGITQEVFITNNIK